MNHIQQFSASWSLALQIIFLGLFAYEGVYADQKNGTQKPNCTIPYYSCRQSKNPGCDSCMGYVTLGYDIHRPLVKKGQKINDSTKKLLAKVEQCKNEIKSSGKTLANSDGTKDCRTAILRCIQTKKNTEGCGHCMAYAKWDCDETDPIIPHTKGSARTYLMNKRGYLLKNIEMCFQELESVKEEKHKVVGTCQYDDEIIALEKKADEVLRLGGVLKKFISSPFPELPNFSYTVDVSKNEISMNFKDNDDFFQNVVNFTDSINNFLGYFVDISPFIPILGDFEFTEKGMIKQGTSSLLIFADLVKEAILSNQTNKVTEDEMIEFTNSMFMSRKSSKRMTKRIICVVKAGLPKYYKDYDDLMKMNDDLSAKIKNNAACPSTYPDLIKLKLQRKDNVRTHLWHISSIHRPAHMDTGGWSSRHSWLDAVGKHNGKFSILENVNCEALKN